MSPEYRSYREQDHDAPRCPATYRHTRLPVFSYCSRPPHPGDPYHRANDAAGHYLFAWTEPSDTDQD